jgi:copper chaperone CopZ
MRRTLKPAVVLVVGLALVLVVAGCGRVKQARTVFTVEGMHCDGCSSAITEALAGTDGVEEASADHGRGMAEVIYRPREVSAEELEAEIEKLGYTVTGARTEVVEG